MAKPRIICFSKDSDLSFQWESDGWYRIKDWGKPKNEALLARAKEAIDGGKTVPEVIKRLRRAGFTVVRT